MSFVVIVAISIVSFLLPLSQLTLILQFVENSIVFLNKLDKFGLLCVQNLWIVCNKRGGKKSQHFRKICLFIFMLFDILFIVYITYYQQFTVVRITDVCIKTLSPCQQQDGAAWATVTVVVRL